VRRRDPPAEEAEDPLGSTAADAPVGFASAIDIARPADTIGRLASGRVRDASKEGSKMRNSFRLVTVLIVAVSVAACADDPDDPKASGDYSACGELQNNQIVTCDSVLRSVEDLCGFNLTVDPCACAAEIADCISETGWLEQIIFCEDDSADCAAYIACLQAVGDSPSGCDSAVSWDCIVPKPTQE
jgi:hypothetical protein